MSDHTLVADSILHLTTHVPGFNIRDYTQAPLRIRADYQFDLVPELLFEKMTDPKMIARWFHMVKDGYTDHSQSETQGQWGRGSKRYCQTGLMGTLDETIYYWDEPNVVAYNVKSWSMPVKDHCAVMHFQAQGRHSTRLIWLQYFNDKGLVMRHFMPKMMANLMRDGLESFRKEAGGIGGQVSLL